MQHTCTYLYNKKTLGIGFEQLLYFLYKGSNQQSKQNIFVKMIQESNRLKHFVFQNEIYITFKLNKYDLCFCDLLFSYYVKSFNC